MQIEHFSKLIELVSIEPKYNPNETPLKVATLTTFKNQLETINTSLKTIYTPYKNAMINRDTKLYSSETGIVDTAQTVKNYVKSVFGASSPQFKQISKLVFRKLK